MGQWVEVQTRGIGQWPSIFSMCQAREVSLHELCQ